MAKTASRLTGHFGGCFSSCTWFRGGTTTATPGEPPSATAELEADIRQLHSLGYAQELRRRMSGFSNFAVSFSIISILSGCLTLYGYGMGTGGPSIIVWGW